jgi:hypothetical protein
VHAVLLDEWLAVAHERGRRPPHDALPALLGRATRRPGLRDAVRAAAGPRGAWLAARRPDWRWVLGPDDLGDPEERWRTGTRDERLAVLAAVRAADPARARAMAATTFATDDPDTRVAVVAALGDGLGEDDEPFLATALADRRAPVRAAAAALLLRLPGSALAARMADAARPLLREDGDAYVVTAPHALPAELERRPPRGTGERAFWLEQLLAAAPLAMWGDPAAALARRLPPEWAGAVRAGWARAAARQRDAAWARGLLAHRDDADLAALLTPAEREEHAASRVAQAGAGADPAAAGALAALVDACPGPWGAALSTAVLAVLARALTERRPHGIDALAADRATAWAARLAPALLAGAEDVLLDAANRAPYGARPALRTLELVTARRDMLAALA